MVLGSTSAISPIYTVLHSTENSLHKNTKTHGHNGDAEKDDEDDKDEQGRRQM